MISHLLRLFRSVIAPSWRTARLALLAIQAVAIWAFAAPWADIDGFALDDSWIHQVVGRTFAQTGTLGYSAGHHGAAATSYLWGAILAANFRFVHVDPVAYTLVINIACLLLVGQVLLAMFWRTPGAIFCGSIDATQEEPERAASANLACLLVVALGCCGGNFVWIAFSGMEQMLFVALSLLAISLFTEHRVAPRRSALLAGICAGVLAVTRPEAIVFGPFLVVASFFVFRRSLRELALFLAPWAAAVALYVGSNLHATGTAMPATLSGRKWLWLGVSTGRSHLQMVVDFLDAWVARLREYTLGTTSTFAFWLGLGLAIFGIVRMVRSKNAALRLVVAWAGLHFLTYVVILPSPGQGGRYQVFTLLLYLVGIGVGSVALAGDLLRLITRTSPRANHAASYSLASVVSLAGWVALVAAGLHEWQDDNARAVSHVRATEVGLGALIDRLPANAKVASFDIGGAGWASHRPIVDLGGLVDADSAAAMIAGDTWKYLRDHAVDYTVLSLPYDESMPEPVNIGYRLRLLDNPALRLVEVRELSSPPAVWIPSVRSTWNTAARQVLYKIEYTGAEGPYPLRKAVPLPLMRDPEHLLRSRAQQVATYGEGLLQAFDVSVRLEATNEPPASAVSPAPGAASAPNAQGDAWHIVFGSWGVAVDVPSKPGLPANEARALVAEAMVPYLQLQDYGGAAVSGLYAVLKATRRWQDTRILPILPPLAPPLFRGEHSELEDDLPWSAPVALGTALLCLSIAALSRDPAMLRRAWSRVVPKLRRGSAAAPALVVLLVLAGSNGCSRRAEIGRIIDDGDESAIRYAETLPSVDERDASGDTLLERAAERAHPELIRYLLSRGATPGAVAGSQSALHLAVESNCLPCAEELIAAGAAVSAPGKVCAGTPLHEATWRALPEMANLLLASGADLDAHDCWGETPLHAVAEDPIRTALLLAPYLARHPDLAARDMRGWTPLHLAVTRDNAAFIRTWAAAGGDLDTLTAAGDTALDLAITRRRDLAEQTLFALGAKAKTSPDTPPPIFEAARTDDVSRATRLLAWGADPQQPWRGQLPVDVARASDSTEVAALLASSTPRPR